MHYHLGTDASLNALINRFINNFISSASHSLIKSKNPIEVLVCFSAFSLQMCREI